MKSPLIEDQHHQNRRLTLSIFSPLLEGKPVTLSVDDPRLLKKQRAYSPALVVVPLEMQGGKPKVLLVALPPHGSEMVRVPQDLKPITFSKLGLNIMLSRVLCETLLHTLGESHGKT